MAAPKTVILVHGWSVTKTSTYGQLAARLAAERPGKLDVQDVWLSQYVSFRDEVRLEDLARGFEAALRDKVGDKIDAGERIAVITHSTGGPVVRDWWDRFYVRPGRECPVSHLVMLAPANFGSALAQLGKSRLSGLRSWFKGVEPGQGVLDWLELGSPESWDLNRRWITEYDDPAADEAAPVYLFELTGQTIDRKLYDHANSYTGEVGSDGTVRVAAANLNATYVRLVQEEPRRRGTIGDSRKWLQGQPEYTAAEMTVEVLQKAPRTAFALVRGRSHVGEPIGIMESVKAKRRGQPKHPTVETILTCLAVDSRDKYIQTCNDFDKQNDDIHQEERIEVVERFLLPDPVYFHDTMTMAILRLRDERDHQIADFDFKFVGPDNDPDALPQGFFQDRQRNQRDRSVITYYMNHSKLAGCDAVYLPRKPGKRRKRARAAIKSLPEMGIQVIPRPRLGYVHYLIANYSATNEMLNNVLQGDQTVMLDIVLRRVVRQGVHGLSVSRGPDDFERPIDFQEQKVGRRIE